VSAIHDGLSAAAITSDYRVTSVYILSRAEKSSFTGRPFWRSEIINNREMVPPPSSGADVLASMVPDRIAVDDPLTVGHPCNPEEHNRMEMPRKQPPTSGKRVYCRG
jgi:hypothetical protein